MAESVAGFESISNPGVRQDVARVTLFRFQLLSQVADEHAQVFGLFDTVFTPDGREQRAVGNDFARVPCQIQK